MNERTADELFKSALHAAAELLSGKSNPAKIAIIVGALRAASDVAEQSVYTEAEARGENVEQLRELFRVCRDTASGMFRVVTISVPTKGGADDGSTAAEED